MYSIRYVNYFERVIKSAQIFWTFAGRVWSKIRWVVPKKSDQCLLLSFHFTYYNLYTVYTTDIKEDTIVCTPFYPVSEVTGSQLVINNMLSYVHSSVFQNLRYH